MKKVLIGLLMITLYAVAQPGQSKYQGRSGYQQSIIWNDLHKSLQDSIRNIVGDSASANITDSLDALTASNGIVYSGRDFSADTTFLSTVTGLEDTINAYFPVTNANLAGSITDSKLNTITTTDKVAGTAVQLSATGALNKASGLGVNVDDVQIEINGSNKLAIITGSITSAKMEDGAGVGYVDLTQALKDSIAGAGTKNITYNYNGFTQDTTVSFYIGSVDTAEIDISGWSFTVPVVQAMTEYDGYYGASIKSIDGNYLVLKAKNYGFDIVHDSCKVTIGVNEQ